MRIPHLLRLSLPVVVLLAAAPAVFGQDDTGPAQSLFGPQQRTAGVRKSLNLFVSAIASYDTNAPSAAAGDTPVQPVSSMDGTYGGLRSQLRYLQRSRRGTLEISGSALVRHYQVLPGVLGDASGSLSYSYALAPRTTFRAGGSAMYSQSFQLDVLPGLATTGIGDMPDYNLYRRPQVTFLGDAALDHRLTPRATLSFDGAVRHEELRAAAGSELTQLDPSQSVDDGTAGTRVSYRVGQGASFVVAYHYQRVNSTLVGGVLATQNHDVEAGVEYRSAGGRTTLGAMVGTTALRAPTSLTDPQLQTSFNASANAHVTSRIGEHWQASVQYLRAFQYLPGFLHPLFTDSLTAGVSGQAGRRVQLEGTFGYSRGEVGPSAQRPYWLYNGLAGAQFGVSRNVAFYAQYLYYHYLFDPTVQMPFGIAPGLNRQGVRGGVTMWFPVMRTGRPEAGGQQQ